MFRFAPFAHPSFLNGLVTARDCQRFGGHIVGDGAACRDIRAVADGQGRNQRRVRADEHAVANHGAVLALAVVVAGNRARADIGALANRRVA
jgi:hypothetical protein